MSPVQPSLFLSKYNHSVSVNESFYDKKVGATQTDPDLALRLTDRPTDGPMDRGTDTPSYPVINHKWVFSNLYNSGYIHHRSLCKVALGSKLTDVFYHLKADKNCSMAFSTWPLHLQAYFFPMLISVMPPISLNLMMRRQRAHAVFLSHSKQ